MARFQCRQDAFRACQQMECLHAFVIGDTDVMGTTGIFQECMFRADAGVIEPR